MIWRLIGFLVLLAGWALAGWLWLGPGRSPDVPQADPYAVLVEEFGLGAASVGISVLDGDGQERVAWNAGQALIPASALKALTAAFAMEVLGPDFRFVTTVAAASAPIDGVVTGDIILRGTGDPMLRVADLHILAEDVVAAGVLRIDGRIIADAGAFPARAASDHWNWGDVGNAYGAGVFGINLERNRYRVRFRPGSEVGAPAEFLGTNIALPGVEWRNFVLTGPAGSGDGVMIYSGPRMPVVELRGTVPLGEAKFSVDGAIPDPPLLAVAVLQAELLRLGVEIAGDPAAPEPVESVAGFDLAGMHSAPLNEICRYFLGTSDNVASQAVFLAAGGRGAFVRYWETKGFRFEGLRIEDGSGLARANRIRPVDMARCLFAANDARADGQLSDLLPGSGVVRGKAGVMSGVRTHAGYLQRSEGRPWTYAVLGNGLPPDFDFRTFLSRVWELAEGSGGDQMPGNRR